MIHASIWYSTKSLDKNSSVRRWCSSMVELRRSNSKVVGSSPTANFPTSDGLFFSGVLSCSVLVSTARMIPG